MRTPARRPPRGERVADLVGRRRLEQVTGCAGGDGIEQVALGLADGEDHDRADRRAALDDEQASATGHVQVAHDEVGPTGLDDVDRPLGVVGLADDLEASPSSARARANDGMVVGEHDADHRRRPQAHLRPAARRAAHVGAPADRLQPPVDRLGQAVTTLHHPWIEPDAVIAHAGEDLPVVVRLGEHHDRAALACSSASATASPIDVRAGPGRARSGGSRRRSR